MTSPDGITWTERTSASGSTWWTSVASIGPQVVAVSDTNGAPYVGMYSPDAISWTQSTLPATNNWRCVRNNLSTYVAVSDSGVGNRVMTSTDGINWASQVSAADNAWKEVVWGPGVI